MRPLQVAGLCAISLLAEDRLSADKVQADINTIGAKAVVKRLTHSQGGLHNQWNSLEDGVASGSEKRLRIASEVKPYTDAGTSEGLGNAMADALPKNPRQVLALLGNDFTVENTCSGGQFIETPVRKVRAYLRDAKTAVAKVEDPALRRSGRPVWRR